MPGVFGLVSTILFKFTVYLCLIMMVDPFKGSIQWSYSVCHKARYSG